MSEPRLTIYDVNGQQVAWSKHGVFWRISPRERLGEFFDLKYFDNLHKQIAYLVGDTVYSMADIELGKVGDTTLSSEHHFKAKSILIEGVEIAKCFPGKVSDAAAAAIVFIGPELYELVESQD